ncbi:MAG TPA: N-acetylmuramoyl-L-alanine amidase [Prevotellaceae bacterium]|nr:N-acetylmuramoyl-L-alanine amidase [Prevotellaceae bacterium]
MLKKTRIILATLLCFVCGGLPLMAQRTNQAYWTYIDRHKDWAIEQMKLYRIPASITLAQGLLESNAGRSTLATEANNHFGIKCGGSWTGPYVLRDDDAPNEKFRKYPTTRDSYIDHSLFLQGRRYQSLFQLDATDYKGWARGLKAAGYATSPTYAESLIRLIEMYNLSQFDSGRYMVLSSKKGQLDQDPFYTNHVVYRNNKNYFIVVEPGDDMATISQKTGVSLKDLYNFNDLPLDYAATAGDIIYLQKKRKCASKEFKDYPIHIVEPNQSMHDICQLYGIRLKYLYRLNRMQPDHTLVPGEILRIR